MADLLYKELAFEVIGAAMEVHRVLGPGFLEGVYQKAIEQELNLRKVAFVSQKHIEIVYKDVIIADYYLDLVVDDKIEIELKAVSQLDSIHQAQIMSYLKASKLRLGLLINFGEASLKTKRVVL